MEDLRVRVKRGESVIFVVPTSGKVDRLREILKDYEIPYDRVIERNRVIEPSGHRVIEETNHAIARWPDRPMARSADHPITRFRPRCSLRGARFAKAWPFPN